MNTFNPEQQFIQDFKISEKVYSGFIEIFNDKNPLHTSTEFAQGKGFSSKVMHGNILNGFLSYFIGECLPIKNIIIQSQEINYKKPVYLEDELVLHAKVKAIFESVNTIEFSFYYLRGNEKVAKGKFHIGII